MTSVQSPTAAAPARSHLARSGALSFAGSATSAVMGLVLIVALGRSLGDVGAGVVLQAIAAFTIALGLARMGMDSAALWILPRLADGERNMVRPMGWMLLGVAALGGMLGALGLIVTATLIDTTAAGPLTARTLRGIALFLPPAAVMLTALAATRAMGKVTTYVLIGSVALPTLRPVLVLIVVAMSGGAFAAGVAWAVPLVPAAAAAVVVLALQMRRTGPSSSFAEFRRSPLPARTMRYALPRVASSTLEQLLVWLAVPIVGALAGAAAAGVYGSAARFVAAGMVVDTALRVVVAPLFSRLMHRGDNAEIEDLHRTATIWLVLFSAPVYLLLAIFAPVVLSLLGKDFAAGAPVLTIMCLGALTTFLAGNIHSVLLMSGRSGLAALNKAAAVAVNLALLITLVPLWGIPGAAVAWAAACMLDALLASLQVRYVLHLNVTPRPALRPLLVGITTIAIPALVLRITIGATFPALIIAAAIGLCLLLLVCRLDRRRLRLDELSLLARKRKLGSPPRAREASISTDAPSTPSPAKGEPR